MESYKENGTVILRRETKNVGATRIIKKSPLLDTSRVISVSKPVVRPSADFASRNFNNQVSSRVDLTNKDFSVTRARAHAPVRTYARAYAREENRVQVNRENNLGLKRVLDAALTGGDVKVAAIEPMSFMARLIAFLLIPVILITPLVPAYANEAPLAERVASDVAVALGNTSESAPVATNDTPKQEAGDVVQQAPTENSSEPTNTTTTPEGKTEGEVPKTEAPKTDTPNTTPSGEVAGAHDENKNNPTTGGGGGSSSGSGNATTPSDNTQSQNNSEQTSTTSAPVVTDNQKPADNHPKQDTVTSPENKTQETADEQNDNTQILDVPSQEVQEDLQSLRARLREEVKAQVRNELKKEVEREVYAGCKNLDGTGYYCIPDAKGFGTAAVSKDNNVTAVVQPDQAEGDKEIFLVRDGVAVQLTHNSDDDVFPVLDPATDLLVWQSLVKGHWQIAYAHVNDPGVPQVHYLTDGENNFNPKVYRGRIVWQVWADGNWEIFTVTKAKEKIEDDALTAEHRIAHVDGNWDIRRITANNVPDMFPSVTSDNITWQSMDDGVWQVFSYDLSTGVARRVSKKGVKSELPRTALVWTEEDETGQMRLVGSDVNNAEELDFTALARRIVDQSKDRPKTPITTTEVVVEKPTTVRTEEEVVVQ